jgi:peptidoglycan hydrolase CwlO-like protein
LRRDVTTVQNNITAIQPDVPQAKADIGALRTDVTTAQNNITAIQADVAQSKAELAAIKLLFPQAAVSKSGLKDAPALNKLLRARIR